MVYPKLIDNIVVPYSAQFLINFQLLDDLKTFDLGNPQEIKPDLMLNEQGDLLPYDQTYEFPAARIKLGKLLGAGAFGIVVKATALGIVQDEEETTVAVKMVKSNANYEVWQRLYVKSMLFSYIYHLINFIFQNLRSLISELKILIHLGKHLNVVNLLGAVTKNLNKRKYYFWAD